MMAATRKRVGETLADSTDRMQLWPPGRCWPATRRRGSTTSASAWPTCRPARWPRWRPPAWASAGLLMRALAAQGDRAEAVLVFDALRRRLHDDLGMAPSSPLIDLHAQLLRA
jgi:Bacterial transcriptional activator domain